MQRTPRCPRESKVEDAEEMNRIVGLLEPAGLIKDRTYHLKAYKDCLVGSELIDWVLKNNVAGAEDRAGAVCVCERLFDGGHLHHVVDGHEFKDKYLFYRVAKEDDAHGPSVKDLQAQSNIQKGEVMIKGRWSYDRFYAVLSREKKTLYLFASPLGSTPRRVLPLESSSFTVSECSECRRGFLCLQLQSSADTVLEMCVDVNAGDSQDAWLHAFVSAGVGCLDEDSSLPGGANHFYKFSAQDIDDKQVVMDRYRGRVALIVNVATM